MKRSNSHLDIHDNYNDNDSNRDYSDNQNNIPIDIAGDTKSNKNKNNSANDRNSNNDTNNNIKNNLNISDTKSVSTTSSDLQNLEPKPVILSDFCWLVDQDVKNKIIKFIN